MQLPWFDACRLRRLRIRFATFLGAFILLYAALGTPLDLVFSSDVAFSGTFLPSLWSVLLMLLNYLFYWVSFAFLLYTALRFPLRCLWTMFAIYASGVVLRYAASQFSYYCVMGFSEIRYFVSEQLFGLLFSILMDLFQFGLAFLFFFLVFRRVKAPQGTADPASAFLPFEKLFGFSNPLQRAAFFVSLIPAGVSLLQRLYFDIFVYGAPMGSADLLIMIVYYLSDIAAIFIGWIVIAFCLERMHLSEARARLNAEKD